MHAADKQTSPIEAGRPSSAAVGWATCLVLAGVLYALTASRGAQWQDSGYHILRVVTHEVVNPLGLALSHPLHHWLGRFAVGLGFVEPCFAVTLVSALSGAIAVANVFGCVLTLTGSRGAGVFAAGSLAVAHTFWQMSTLAETYTLAAALLSGECWCVALYARRRRPEWVAAAMLLNGLGVANHMLAALTTPVVLAVAWVGPKCEVRSSKRWAAVGCAAWGVGALPYLLLVLREYHQSGQLWATLGSALFGNGYRGDVLNARISLGSLGASAGFVLMNFPNLLLAAAVAGACSKCGPTLARRALVAGLTLHAIFVVRYSVVDQLHFFVPMDALLAILGGVGWYSAGAWRSARARSVARAIAAVLLCVTPIFYAMLPAAARYVDLPMARGRHKPYRDSHQYLFTPWSVVETSAEKMSSRAVALAGANGLVVVEDRMAEFAVRYQALKAPAPAPAVVPSSDDAAIRAAAGEDRRIVLVPLQAGNAVPALGGCRWEPEEDLFVLKCGARKVAPD
jgi:hypothetical protein